MPESDAPLEDDIDQEASAANQDDDEKPALDDDEIADLSAVAEDVREAEAEEAEESEEDVDENEDVEDDSTSSTPATERNWGDMYVSSLTTGLNALVEEHGRDGAETIDEAMARDLHLDEAFDEWMAKKGRSDMPPEQELLIGTLLLSGTVVLSKTTLLDDALDDAI